MPELAEVEYYRKQWEPGKGQKILEVSTSGKRVFRGGDLAALGKTLKGATLLESFAHGKQMLFRFSKDAWLGVHLGMTGELAIVKGDGAAAKHQHLVLRQARQSLVFNDPRQFGRILFDTGKEAPAWWRRLPPQILSKEFTLARMTEFLKRHGRAPMKAVLLSQAGFPGIGNWMADEILWQAKINPRRKAGSLKEAEIREIFARTKSVSKTSLRTVGTHWRDLPKTWLFGYRWKSGGVCPRDKTGLRRATIGGRTTCWCPNCQV